MTDYIVSYRTNFLGLGTGINSTIISKGVLDLSSFSLPGLSDVSDTNEFFDAFSTAGRSFSYEGTTLTLRFSDGTDSHSITISGFGTRANAGFRIKTDANSESDFLVSQLASSLVAQTITNTVGGDLVFEGNSGADTLIGGAGADTIDGHGGDDTTSYRDSTGGIIYDATSVADAEGFRAVTVDGAGNDKLKSIEKVVGSLFDDTFTLGANDGLGNRFEGLVGDDTFTVKFDDSTTNNHRYFGDALFGGSGSDTLSLEGTNNAGALVVNLNLGTMSIAVGGGTPIVQHLRGFEDVDLHTGSYSSNQAFTFSGSSTDNILTFSGEDMGKVTINAWGGEDILDLSNRLEGVTINQLSIAQTLGGDEIVAYELSGGGFATGSRVRNFEEIIGSAGDDVIFTDLGNDKITAGGGDDHIKVGKGSDVVDGGTGSDTIDYSDANGRSDGLDINLRNADEVVEGEVTGVATFSRIENANEKDTLTNIENIIGTNARDILAGNDQDNTLDGGFGWDTLSGEGGDDTIRGGWGNDIIDGGAGNDNIEGGDHDDTIDGGAGDDTILGGSGNDIIAGGDGVGILSGGAGEDIIGGGADVDTIDGGADNDIITGFAGADTIYGRAGDDTIDGGAGADTLSGGAGDDTFLNLVDEGVGIKDIIDGGSGFDTADFSSLDNTQGITFSLAGSETQISNGLGTGYVRLEGTDRLSRVIVELGSSIEKVIGTAHKDHMTAHEEEEKASELHGGGGDDTLIGSFSDDKFYGDAGNDILSGSAGDDTLDGGDGNDDIRGGAGTNTLVGGKGSDTFVIYQGSTNSIADDVDTASKGTIDLTNLRPDPKFPSKFFKSFDAATAGERLLLALDQGFSFRLVNEGSDLELKYTDASGTETQITIEDFHLNADNYDFVFKTKTAGMEKVSGSEFNDLASRLASKIVESIPNNAGNVAKYLAGSNFDDILTGRNAGDEDAIDNIYGFAGDDSLIGLLGNDKLYGGAGDDTLAGGAGGGRGDGDTMDGGDGVDTVDYRDSAAGVGYNFTQITGAGQGGDAAGDKIGNVERALGSKYGDTFIFSAGEGNAAGNDIRYIAAGAGDDWIAVDITRSGTRDGITLIGGFGGSDTLSLKGEEYRELKSMTVNLDTGKLTFTKTDGPKVYSIDIRGFENVNLINAAYFGKWTVVGTNFANEITLSGRVTKADGSGKLNLYNGNDEVVFKAAADIPGNLVITGGGGGDTVDFADIGKSLNINLLSTTVDDIDAGTGTGDVDNVQFIGVEHIISSSVHALTLTGNAANGRITGSSVVDTITGGGGIDRINSLGGSDIVAADRADIIIVDEDSAGEYDHLSYAGYRPVNGQGITIDLSNVATVVLADVVRYVSGGFYFSHDDAGFQSLIGSAGHDDINVGSRVFELYGGAGRDTLTSGSRSTRVDGEVGNDILVLGAVADGVTRAAVTLDGGANDDQFLNVGLGSTANVVTIAGGTGVDVVDFSSGVNLGSYNSDDGYGVSLTLNSGQARVIKIESEASTEVATDEGIIIKDMSGIEKVIGTNNADSLTGDSGSNVIEGRGGADRLAGGAGVDTLYGGDGADRLAGGSSLVGGSADIGGKDNFLRPDGSALGFFKIGNAGKNILQGNLGADTYVIAPNSINEIADGNAGAVVDFTGAGTIGFGGNAENGRLLSRFLRSDVADNSFASSRNGDDLVIVLTQTDEVPTGDTAADTTTSTFSSYLTSEDPYVTITTIKNFYVPGVASRYTFKFTGTEETRAGDIGLAEATFTGVEFISAFASAPVENIIDISGEAVGNGGREVIGLSNRDVISDNAGDNVLRGLGGFDVINGNDGDDTIYGGYGADIITGGRGADTIYGYDKPGVAELRTAFKNTLQGNEGDDTIYGSKGNDEIDGGADTDIIYGGAGADTIRGGEGDDKKGSGRNEVGLSGGAGDDKIYGDAGDDTLFGDGGKDILEGGDGVDSIYGGDGDDIIRGGDGNDNRLHGGAGNDEIYGGAGDDEGLEGGEGDDTIEGGIGNDFIGGGGGNDTLLGQAGDDNIEGYDGIDTIDGGAGNDELRGEDGNDILGGGDGDDSISGGEDDDTIAGGDGIDDMSGDEGNDVLDGGRGNDIMEGGDGNDRFINLGIQADLPNGGSPASGLDAIDGDDGMDTADFSKGGLIDAGIKVDLAIVSTVDVATSSTETYTKTITDVATVTLNDEASPATKVAYLKNVENIDGTKYADDITGDGQDNILRGLVGDDTLSGGGGNDRLEGGYGADTYEITAGSETTISDADSGRSGVRSTIDLTALAPVVIGAPDEDTTPILQFLEAAGVETSRTGNHLILEIIVAAETTRLTVEDFYNAPRSYYFLLNTKVDAAAETVVIEQRGGVFSFGNTAKRFAGANQDALTGAALKNDDLVGRNNADEGDTLSGLSGNDKLAGLAGDDTLLGGKGGDVLIGGPGADVLDGGSGFDTAVYSYSAAGISLALAKSVDTFSIAGTGGQAAGDTLKDVEKIIGSNYGDSIAVEFDTQEAIKYEVVAGSGLDSLTVNFGTAAAAADVSIDINFDGGVGIDTLILAGKLNLAEATDALAINLGADAIQLGAVSLKNVENIDLTGFTSNADVVDITGTAVANVLTLGELTSVRVDMLRGYDFVHIGDAVKGITSLDGGLGIDTLNFASRTLTKGITLDLATGTIQDNEATMALIGGAGSVAGFENVVGSLGADTLTGGAGANSLLGGLGDDILQGGAGNDVLDGGDGIDTVSYAGEIATTGWLAGVSVTLRGATNAIFSRAGSRELDAISNVENIIGSEGNDFLSGNVVTNKLEGRGGDDIIRGGLGGDVISGGDGDDTIRFTTSTKPAGGAFTTDVVDGGAGENDLADFTGIYFRNGDTNTNHGIKVDLADAEDVANVANVKLNVGGVAGDKIATLDNIEHVSGTGYRDVIAGSNVANTLRGNGGNDDIYSGGGSGNFLIGGLGADNYFIEKGSGSTITDGIGLSTIDLTDVGVFSGLTADNSGARNLLALLKETGVSYERPAGTFQLVLKFVKDGLTTDLKINGFYRETSDYNFVFKHGTDDADTVTIAGGEFINIFNALELNLDGNTESEALLEGGFGDDTLLGRNEVDLVDNIVGSTGDDRLVGFAGADIIDGGDGIDTVDYRTSDAGVTMTLSATAGGLFTDVSGGHASGRVQQFNADGTPQVVNGENVYLAGVDSIKNVEIVWGSQPVGGGFGDTFTLSARDAVDYIVHGYSGADKFIIDFANAEGNYLGDELYGGGGVDSLALKGSNTEGAVAINFARGMMYFKGTDGSTTSVVVGFEDLNLAEYTSDQSLKFIGTAGNNKVTFGVFETTSALSLAGGDGVDTLDFMGRANDIIVDLTKVDSAVYGIGNSVSGFENIVGGTGVDTLTGSGVRNVISGGAGVDTISGKGGNDRILGEDGNDFLRGDGGSDFIDGGVGIDTISHSGERLGVNIVLGEGVNDAGEAVATTFSRIGNRAEKDIITNVENIIGSEGNDVLTGISTTTRIDGGGGDDTITGGSGAASLYGGAGNDVLRIGKVAYAAGTDALVSGTIDGGAGDRDIIDFSKSSYTPDGGDEAGVTISFGGGESEANLVQSHGRKIVSFSNIEGARGTDFADLLSGGAGNDILYGGKGVDIINSYQGTNHLAGGAGRDTYRFGGHGTHTIVDDGGIINLFSVGGGDPRISEDVYDFFASFQDLNDRDTITFTRGGELIIKFAVNSAGTGELFSLTINNFRTNADDYNFQVQNSSGAFVTFTGQNLLNLLVARNIVSNSDEFVAGSIHADTMTGGAANQIFDGLSGNDKLYGNGGDDALTGGAGSDQLYGGVGEDTLHGGAGNDRLEGGVGADILNGGTGSDQLYGGDGDDTRLAGGEGNDFIDGGKGSDTITGGAGVDTIYGRADDDTIDGGTGNDYIDGAWGIDTITGGAGNDRLFGGVGNDGVNDGGITGGISGGSGNDVIDGGSGDDILNGDAGDDRFIELGTATSGVDTIDGGAGDDLVDFSGAGAVVSGRGAGLTVDFSVVDGDGGSAVSGGRGQVADASYGTLKNVEDIIATRYADSITLDKLSDDDGNNILLGAGYDELVLKDAALNKADIKDIYDGGIGVDTLDLSAVAHLDGVRNFISLAGNEPVPLPIDRPLSPLDNIPDPTATYVYGQVVTNGDDVLGDFTVNFIGPVEQQRPLDATFIGGEGYDTYMLPRSNASDEDIFPSTDITVIDDGGLIDLTRPHASAGTGTKFVVKDGVTEPVPGGYVVTAANFFTAGPTTDPLNSFVNYASTTPYFTGKIESGNLIITINNNGGQLSTVKIDDFLYNAAGFTFRMDKNGNDEFSDVAGADVLAALMLIPGSITSGSSDVADDSHAEAGTGDGYLTRVKYDGTTIEDYDQVALLRNFEHVKGTAGDDRIVGTNAVNMLDGGAGNDHLVGDSTRVGAENGNIVGGNDIIIGGAGNDILLGMAGNDDLDGGAGVDKLYGGRGYDILAGGAGADVIAGGAGIDTLSYAGTNNGITLDLSGATSHSSVATGSGGDAGGDTVSSVENIIGSDGNDIITGSNAFTSAYAAEATVDYLEAYPDSEEANFDKLAGFEDTRAQTFNGANRLEGGAGDDTLKGMGGNDVLLGGIGDDTLQGGTGSDTIDGGAGDDTVSYKGEEVGVNIALRGAINAVFSRVDSREFDAIRNVENIIGSDGGDTLTGNALANKLYGEAGNDVIRGGDGNDDLRGVDGDDTIYGNLGNDVILGGIGNDTLGGGAGDDTIEGGTGNDVIRGGSGNDNLKGDAGADTIYTNAGIETIDGGAGDDTIEFAAAVKSGAVAFDVDIVDGGADNDLADFSLASFQIGSVYHGIKVDLSAADGDTVADVTLNEIESGEKIATLDNIEHVYGTEYKDVITGNDGDNIIFGNGRGDTISGGAGEDTIDGGTGWDTIDGGADADTIDGGLGNDIIDGGDGNDILRGGSHDDTIDGEGGHDEIYGGDGIDTIYGGVGDDTISGGTGNDHLHGGLGENILIGGANFDTYYITENSKNTITDIAGLIDFTNLGNIVNANGLETFLTGLHANTGNLGSAVGFDSTGLTLKIGKAAANTGDDPILTSIRIDGFTLENAASFSFRFLDGDGGKYIVQGSELKNIIFAEQTVNVGKNAGELNLDGDVFSDRLTGNIETNILNGGTGGDSLYGYGGADTLNGDAGNDLLVGGPGADIINGGAGMDTVSYATSAQAVSLMLTADQTATDFAATGGQANGDVVDGVEKFIGSQYADSFSLAVADVTKAYILDGGLGSADTLKLTGAAATAFALDLAAGTFAIGGSISTISNIERIDISSLTTTGGQAVITGIARADYITIGDADSAYTNTAGITGDLGKGWDTLYIGNYDIDSAAGINSDFTLTGGIGVDTVDFSARADNGATFYFADRGFEQAIGSKQGDRFYSDDNANNINGGAGIDTIDYSEAGSSVVASLYLGTRVQTGSVASQGDILANIENIVGSAHADTIIGSSVNNVIEGGAGADTINGGGGAGIDTASYAGSSDGVDVNLNVILRIGLTGYGYGSGGDADGDRLLNIENIIGSAGVDTLTGNEQNNRLEGGAGDDTLIGGAGADTLIGGAGADILNGGAGVDIYIIKFADGISNTITDADGGIVRFDFTVDPGERNNDDLVVADSSTYAGFTIKDYYVGDNKDGYTIQRESTNDGVTTYTDFTDIPT